MGITIVAVLESDEESTELLTEIEHSALGHPSGTELTFTTKEEEHRSLGISLVEVVCVEEVALIEGTTLLRVEVVKLLSEPARNDRCRGLQLVFRRGHQTPTGATAEEGLGL